MSHKRTFKTIYMVMAFVMVLLLVNPVCHDMDSYAATTGKIKDNASYVYFRETPGGNPIKDNNGNVIFLHGGNELTILDTTNSAWYQVSLTYNGIGYTGYVSSQYVVINETQPEEQPSVQPETPATPSGDTDFEAKLAAEGFPESYKVMLRAIHEKYPNWEFRAVQTGIEWKTLLDNECNKTGQVKNLVGTSSSYPHYNWRSTSVGYNCATDKWSPYDGSTWFAASDELVTYYLDPRTYLYENYIFVFESLSYQQGVQNELGVEAILQGTFMSNTVPQGETKTYAQIIMDAAAQSGVSPYHIASRIRIEMGATAGIAANGSSAQYPGIYNYYNIGAYDSADGSAVLKGLDWASKSGSYGRPWNSVSKSIIGGAQFLGTSYISVGQNTLYTQKFNVTNQSCLFSHQYMSNVQAPASECLTNYDAYKKNNLLGSSMVFEIPVYNNMPDTACSKPADSGNPNNWLSSLTVDGYSLTPSFSINNTTEYSLIIPESVDRIVVSASTVNSYAKISGTGSISLALGTNKITINVTAQSGNVRTYTLTVVRGTASDTTTDTTPTVSSVGDLNGDGKINVLDIVKLQRIIVGLDASDENIMAVGDLNQDGKISVLDIVRIQRHIVGLEIITN
ncbi:MAG: beta-N-acetylglucosaminidase [Lachnospiraceae bacterium]|nr:beta-N-acetylglucosaminidase [Lachnospiraceae bacterium]